VAIEPAIEEGCGSSWPAHLDDGQLAVAHLDGGVPA
jgi:hypothetical protein